MREIAEITNWYVEDGYEPKFARALAIRHHPYFPQRWQRLRRLKQIEMRDTIRREKIALRILDKMRHFDTI